MDIFSEEHMQELFEKKEYFREHPEEARREYLRTHKDQVPFVIHEKSTSKRMQDTTRQVFCPLLRSEVKFIKECYDITMVAEGDLPEKFVPSKVMETENWREICKNCPNHEAL
ncbi:MAG: hypothetical protein K2J16_07150 [Clostridia bacterium]|nr:hypothetical protein [Clostridia bacterium]